MKGLYICVGQQLDDMTSGIGRKIKSQISTFEKKGYKMTIINVDNKTNFFDKLIFFIPLVKSNFQIREIEAVDCYNILDYDFVYIRKPALSSAIITLLKKIKKQNNKIKIIMEIPTYPIYGEYTGFRKLLILQSMLACNSLYKYVDRITTYSNDNIIWKIKTIKLSNCVDFSKIKPKIDCENDGIINVIAVALFSSWHGYDRFIKGMSEYYQNNGSKEVHLFLVGDSNILEGYNKLVQKYNLTKYVHFCGKLYGEELDLVYNKCELALDALGRHRSKVYYNSSLKGKEYGAKGLPIISGVETELDFDSDYKYYLRVPANENPIDINSVIYFYNSIYYKSETKSQIVDSIRTYSQARFDMTNGFKSVVDYMQNNK